jgi:hypothetical protein
VRTQAERGSDGRARVSDESGYSPEEIERGDDQPGCVVTMSPLGCLTLCALLAGIGYGLWRLMF